MPQLLAEASDLLSRIWEDLVARPSGPLAFRFLLQPVMAATAGIRDGIVDARTGSSPYLWTVFSDSQSRKARLKEGLSATAKILALGVAMDIAYQVLVFGRLYPLEALIVALTLAFLPYLFIRGPTARVVRWWSGQPSPTTMSESNHDPVRK